MTNINSYIIMEKYRRITNSVFNSIEKEITNSGVFYNRSKNFIVISKNYIILNKSLNKVFTNFDLTYEVIENFEHKYNIFDLVSKKVIFKTNSFSKILSFLVEPNYLKMPM